MVSQPHLQFKACESHDFDSPGWLGSQRIVVQKVKNASVTVNGQVVSRIGRGLLGLVGITHDDTVRDAEYLCRKLLKMRLWENEQGVGWRYDVNQIQGEVRCQLLYLFF